MQDFTKRFSGRALAYAKYRPTYPKEEILSILRKKAYYNSGNIVADIGSGTGILTRVFLESGNTVFGVEPNDDMRSVAERNLKELFPSFVSVKGTAEYTTLKERSVDLISVGQALHWFDPELTREEFKRIIAPNGYLCVVYNERKSSGEEKLKMMQDYERIVKKYARDKPKIERVTGESLTRFFEGWTFEEFLLDNKQVLDFDGLLGRLASASYMPKEEDGEQFSLLKQDLQSVFDENQSEGVVTLYYETKISLGPF